MSRRNSTENTRQDRKRNKRAERRAEHRDKYAQHHAGQSDREKGDRLNALLAHFNGEEANRG